MPAIDGGVVLHAGIAAAPGRVRNFEHQIFRFESLDRATVFHSASREIGVAQDGVHEVVSYADGIVGVLEENGAVGFGVGRRSVVSERNQGVRFGFFFGFALDELNDIGMIDIEDDHLGCAAGFATRLDHAGKGVETFHEAEWAAGGASAA